jgi:hypothetical protein
MGLVELTSAITSIAKLRAGTPGAKEAAANIAVEATATRASTTRRDAENLIAEARGITSPCTLSVTTTQ